MSSEQIIAPERQGLWIAATFVIALLGLLIAIVSVYRGQVALAGTQLEVLVLNKKIETLERQTAQAAPAPAPAANSATPAK